MAVISKVLNDAANRLMKNFPTRRYDDIKHYWHVCPGHQLQRDELLKATFGYPSSPELLCRGLFKTLAGTVSRDTAQGFPNLHVERSPSDSLTPAEGEREREKQKGEDVVHLLP